MRVPRVRFTVRRMMIIVACVGVGFWLARKLNPITTVYAAGYSENRFRRISIGMTPEQVEAVMGPPLAKLDWGADEVAIWKYSERASRRFFWRRWVIFNRGTVVGDVSDLSR